MVPPVTIGAPLFGSLNIENVPFGTGIKELSPDGSDQTVFHESGAMDLSRIYSAPFPAFLPNWERIIHLSHPFKIVGPSLLFVVFSKPSDKFSYPIFEVGLRMIPGKPS